MLPFLIIIVVCLPKMLRSCSSFKKNICEARRYFTCFLFSASYPSQARIRMAFTASCTSSMVLKWEKLKRTAPCFPVLSALCMSGAQ